VNDTTRTPKEPDGRAGVTTGKQAGSGGPAPGDAAEKTSKAPGGSPGAGSDAAAAPAPESGTPATTAGQDASKGNGRASVPASSNDPKRGRPAADAPTARLRFPKGRNGATADRGAAPSTTDAAAPTASAAPGSSPGPTVGPPPSAPEPAPSPAPKSTTGSASGSIPPPGPAAASPPPWNRVPGQSRPVPEPGAPGPAGGLLTDGPTAYLLPDATGASDTAAAEPPAAKGWGPMRSGRPRPPRQAALQLKRLDPWSMLKLGLVLAVVIFFIWLVAVGVLYGVLDGMGVWDRLNGTYADLVSGEAPTGSPLISAGRVFGLAAVVGAINSLLFAVAVTIGAFVYNVSADLVGGVEVTLSERD
jgi:hypothetical protein